VFSHRSSVAILSSLSHVITYSKATLEPSVCFEERIKPRNLPFSSCKSFKSRDSSPTFETQDLDDTEPVELQLCTSTWLIFLGASVDVWEKILYSKLNLFVYILLPV